MIDPAHLAALSAVKSIASGEDPSPGQLAFALCAGKGISYVPTSALPRTEGVPPLDSTVYELPFLPEAMKEMRGRVAPDSAEQSPDITVLDGTVVYEDTRNIPGLGEQKTIIVRDLVVDSRYFWYGNLLDLCTRIRNGELPTSSDVILALYDVADTATLGIFHPYLLPGKLNPHTQTRYRRLVAEKGSCSETRTDNPVGVSFEGSEDVRDGKIHHQTTEVTHQTTSRTNTELWRLTEETYGFGPGESLEQLSGKELDQKLASMTPDHVRHRAIVKRETTRTDIKTTEKSGYVARTIFGIDLGYFVGRVEDPRIVQRVTDTTVHADEYVFDGTELVVDLASIKDVSPTTLKSRASNVHGVTRRDESPIVEKTAVGGPKYREGYLSYSPIGGGLVSVASKWDLGENVTHMDMFWAGFDAVTLPVIGLAAVAKGGAALAARQGGKLAAKEFGEVVAKRGVVEASREGVHVVSRKGAQTVAKEGAETTARTGTQAAVREGLEATVKPPSQLLGENLAAHGIPKPSNHAAHHIVAADHSKAVPAREVLERYGIDINSHNNGVWLPTERGVGPGAYHPEIHTNKYFDELNRRFMQAGSKEEALEILQDIGQELAKNRFPY
jgi:hypothetical protein